MDVNEEVLVDEADPMEKVRMFLEKQGLAAIDEGVNEKKQKKKTKKNKNKPKASNRFMTGRQTGSPKNTLSQDNINELDKTEDERRPGTDLAGRYVQKLKEAGSVHESQVSFGAPGISSSGGGGPGFVRPSTAGAARFTQPIKKPKVVDINEDNMY